MPVTLPGILLPPLNVPEVQEVVKYVSHREGGRGAVRDILEQTMKVQGKWMDDDAHHW